MKSWVSRSGLWVLVLGVVAALGCGEDETAGRNVVVMNPNPDMGASDLPVAGQDMPPSDMPVVGEDMPVGPSDMVVEPDMEPMTPVACTSNAGCSAPRVCVVQGDGRAVCADPVGTAQTGATCQDGAQCRSGLCLNNRCAAPCSDNADCPGGFECASRAIPVDGGGQVSLNVCVERPRGCLSDGACTAPQRCVADRSGQDVSLTCQAPVPGAKELGESCGVDGDCVSGLCLDNVCARPCERPNDCATDGSFICAPTTVSTGGGQMTSVNVCRPRPATQCLSDSQCVAPERCVARRTAQSVSFSCGAPNVGAGEVGALCGQDAQCAQGLCLNGRCASPCQGSGDCNAAGDFLCELTEVALENNARESVQVCVPPTPCDDPGDCRLNETCYVRRAPQSLDLYCRAPNAAGGTLGQVCTQDAECASNLCYEGRFGRVCSLPCATNGDCPVAGYECRQVGVASTSGTSVNTRICAPRNPPPCTSRDSCATGLSCAVVPNATGSALEAVCIPTAGRQPVGVACSNNEVCASRLCVQGTCAAPCQMSNQCGSSQVCNQNVNVNKDNLAGTFDLCLVPPDQSCTSSAQCAATGRVCGELRSIAGGGVQAFCRLPNANGAQLGSPCTQDSQCREGLCNLSTNECSVVCNADANCSAAAGQICASVAFMNSPLLGLCTRSCSDNSSCAAGQVCSINPDPPNNDIDQVCQQPVGPLDLGAACNGGGDCNTGLCLSTLLYTNTPCANDAACGAGNVCRCPVEQPNCAAGERRCATVTDRCTRVCDDNGDCAGGAAGNQLTVCSPNIFVTRPDGVTTKQMSFCSQN